MKLMPVIDLNLLTTKRWATSSLMLFLLTFCFYSSNYVYAERDFNLKDSQVPLLEPKDEPPHPEDPYIKELSHCQHTDSDIILSLVLKKHDWQNLTNEKKAKLHEKLSKFFAIPKEHIIMDSVTKHEMFAMQNESMRRGNNKCHINSKHLGRVSFKIGCGPAYFTIGQPIAKQIGHQMRDGSIDNITEEKFGWWIIWRRQLKSRSHRSRRQVEGSGQTDYDDYYDEDEDEEQSVTDVPVPVAAPTESSHAHRHHHGDSDKSEANEIGSIPRNESENVETNVSQAGEASSTTTQKMEEVPSTSSSTPLLTTTSSFVTPTTPIETTASSSFPSTDYVEPKIENTPPMIKTRLQKFAVTSGKSFRFIIPEETFYDTEDNTNLRLELTDKEGHELKPSSWLQYNNEKRELYGLPLDEAVSKWKYLLTATDSGNESVIETLDISVQQHRGLRAVNHEINIAVKINVKGLNNIDWQLKLMEAIAETLGDESVSAIVVREVRQTVQDPHMATFVYFNETLPFEECPEADLNKLVKRLDASKLTDLVYPTLGIKSITGSLIGSCQKIHDVKPKAPTHLAKMKPPIPRNQVDRVNATVNQLLVYKVPGDTFFDPNGNELVLTLRTKENKELHPSHWLQFDSKNQEFYGIPRSAGIEEYLLVAENSAGLTATDALVVVINHAPKRDFSVYYKALLNVKHENFNADLQRKFVERLSLLHGDKPEKNHIQLKSIGTHHDTGGVIITFFNTSLYRTHSRCPEKETENVRWVYLTKDHNLKERVKKALGPELNITKLQDMPLGVCHIHVEIPHREFIPAKTDEPLLKSTFSEEYMMTYIVPAVIIIIMVIVASIIACCLHRRRVKSGKMELGDDEERKSFRPKAPVIFQDELDEKPEIGNKSPIILKNEKPPLLPPSYNTSNMNGDTDVDKYEPPSPVIVNGREARGKSPATPSYRKPPPYVSP